MRVENALRAAGDTHPGLQRAENEDRFHSDPNRGIFLVVWFHAALPLLLIRAVWAIGAVAGLG